jgi:predicted metalloprotease with PDZ domain
VLVGGEKAVAEPPHSKKSGGDWEDCADGIVLSWGSVVRGLVLVVVVSGCFVGPAFGNIAYKISVAHPEQHLFRVEMTVPEVQGEVRLQMAAWNAFYMIRDFSSHVQRVSASVDGMPVEIQKLDKLTWRVKGSGTVTVKYETFWDDGGPFAAQLNAEHAFINPAMILLYVPERRSEACWITLVDLPEKWRVAPSATATVVEEMGPTMRFEVPTFDALADGPIEMGTFEEFEIADLTPKVRVVVHGDGYKRKDLETALRKICAYETKMMEDAPYKEYTFIFHVGKGAAGGGGGMEHADSTAIWVPSMGYLPNVAAHEFFHLWNVKRIKPATLEPTDYTKEMYTRALWFAEGVTNTYASYTLVRSGLWGKQEFYQDLSSQISEVESRPADAWQSAEQSSLDAWLEKYALYNQPSNSVSYYTKGQILGVLLDIAIRDRTNNQKSLDDVLRSMNVEFAKEGKFYQDSLDVRLTAEKVAGGSFAEFFEKYVAGSAALPYAELLGKAGLDLTVKEIARATLGFYMEHETGGAYTVGSVEEGSPGAAAGLKEGDEILKWNGGDVPRRMEKWLAGQRPGEELHLRVRREDKEQVVVVRLGEVREKMYLVSELGTAGERAKRIRDGMLRGTTDAVTAGK